MNSPVWNSPELAAAIVECGGVRADPREVTDAIRVLGCDPSEAFRQFYERYAGAFFSPHTGFELLDIAKDEDEMNVVTQTQACRDAHAFPSRYLAISNLLGNAVLVYDCDTDGVHHVDFEGTHRDLVAGTDEPEFLAFPEFLNWYFLGKRDERSRASGTAPS